MNQTVHTLWNWLFTPQINNKTQPASVQIHLQYMLGTLSSLWMCVFPEQVCCTTEHVVSECSWQHTHTHMHRRWRNSRWSHYQCDILLLSAAWSSSPSASPPSTHSCGFDGSYTRAAVSSWGPAVSVKSTSEDTIIPVSTKTIFEPVLQGIVLLLTTNAFVFLTFAQKQKKIK